MGASWTDCKSKQSFWSVVIFFYFAQQWTVSRSDCDRWQKVDFIWQSVTTSSVTGSRRSSKALSKAKLAPNKGQGHWWSAAIWFTIAFWIHYIWEVCSANRWDAVNTAMPVAGICQQKGPNSSVRQRLTTCCAMNASKVEWDGRWSLTSSAIFIWPLTKWLPLLQASQQLFAGKCFHNQQDAENAFQEFIESWGVDFYAAGIKNLFLIQSMCWFW